MLAPPVDEDNRVWSVNHGLIVNLHQDGKFDVNMMRRGGDIHPDYRIEGDAS